MAYHACGLRKTLNNAIVHCNWLFSPDNGAETEKSMFKTLK